MYPHRNQSGRNLPARGVKRPAWNQNQPRQPSNLRRATSLSTPKIPVIPRSHRVTSLVDLLGPLSDQENDIDSDRASRSSDDMAPARRAVERKSSAELRDAINEEVTGLGIRMNQRLGRVDEWLEHEDEDVAQQRMDTTQSGRKSQTRGPREQVNRQTSASRNDVFDASLMPAPLSLNKKSPFVGNDGSFNSMMMPAPLSLNSKKQQQSNVDAALMLAPMLGPLALGLEKKLSELKTTSAPVPLNLDKKKSGQHVTDTDFLPTTSAPFGYTPSGEPRAYPVPKPKREDRGKAPEQLIDELLGSLYRGQGASLLKEDVGDDENHGMMGGSEVGSGSSTPTARKGTALDFTPSSNHTTASTSFKADSAPSPTPKSRFSPQVSSLSESHQSAGFAVSPVRPNPLRTASFSSSPLRISRKPVESAENYHPETHAEYEPTILKSFPILPSKEGPKPTEEPPVSYGHRIYSKPGTVGSAVIRKQHRRGNNEPRPILYFFDDERESLKLLVDAKQTTCKGHTNCNHCREKEFAYLEIKAMPNTVPPEDRATILAGNRSLRTIKTELENLLEKNLISDAVYDSILQQLPNENSFNTARSASSAPTAAFRDMSVNDPPPSYNTPALPTRQNTAPPAAPEIGRAIALYPYSEPEDCNFIVHDEIVIHEKVNNDWWMGTNVRTGKKGVFPANYVVAKAQGPTQGYPNEKAQPYGGYPGQQYPQQQQHQGPPPPGPSNPYNSDTPPPAIANEPSKGQEMGKKFGKKLGNAAIFGAGATIGGKIVNGIF